MVSRIAIIVGDLMTKRRLERGRKAMEMARELTALNRAAKDKHMAKNIVTTSQMIGSLTREALDATYDDIELKAKSEAARREAEYLKMQAMVAQAQIQMAAKLQQAAQLHGSGPLQALQVLNQLPHGLYQHQAQTQALLNQMPSPQQYTNTVTTGPFAPYQPSPQHLPTPITTKGRLPRIEQYDYATDRIMVRDENGNIYYRDAQDVENSEYVERRHGIRVRKGDEDAKKAKELHGARMKLLHTLRWVHDIKELEEPW